MISSFDLVELETFPEILENGNFYYSKRFSLGKHLCACGCGSVINTPVTPLDWKLKYSVAGISLYPSIHNRNLPCNSHYFIRGGKTLWSYFVSDEDNAESIRRERRARSVYQHADKGNFLARIRSKLWEFINSIFRSRPD